MIHRRAAARAFAAALIAGAAAFADPSGSIAPPAAAQSGDAFRPAAFVDGRAITTFEVEQRQRLLRFSGLPSVGENAALNSMIEDRLKRAAAEAAGITLPREEVERGLARMAAAQGLNAQAFERRLRREGLSLAVVREHVETELLWSSVVRRDYGVQEEVTDLELEDEIEANGLDRAVSYDLGEIVLPAGPGVMERAAGIVAEARGGADFGALARRHSRSPSAPRGGRAGRVPEDRLPPALAQILAGLEPGEVTDPLETPRAVA
ncbi:MAG: peptidylprolyl isomerase, partial [Pseudomonadota bacterium]